MTTQVLNPVLFLNAVTAANASNWIPVDWRFAPAQTRSVMGSKDAAGDAVNIELLITAYDAAGNAVAVTATATTFGGAAGAFSAVIFGPFQQIRARKTGTSAAATVVGLV